MLAAEEKLHQLRKILHSQAVFRYVLELGPKNIPIKTIGVF